MDRFGGTGNHFSDVGIKLGSAPSVKYRSTASERRIMTERNELIVDLRHLSEVGKKLNDLKVWAGSEVRKGVWTGAKQPESNTDLRLALISDLDDLTDAAVRVKAEYANEIDALERQNDRDFTDLDVVLYKLRVDFAHELGMVPMMGKNRDTALAFPQHKGVGDPEPWKAGGNWQAAAGDPQANGTLVGIVDTPLYQDAAFADDGLVSTTDAPARPLQGGVYRPAAGHSRFLVGLIQKAAPDTRIVVKAGLDGGTGKNSVWDTAIKIAEFRGTGIKVLNLSFGTTTQDAQPPLALRRAIDLLVRENPNLLVVAAAGNRGYLARPPRQIWPAAMTAVQAVGATDADYTMKKIWVDMTAPGTDVVGPYLNGRVKVTGVVKTFTGAAKWSGTSFAAANVTGMLAAQLQRGVSPAEALKNVLDGGVVKRFVYAG